MKALVIIAAICLASTVAFAAPPTNPPVTVRCFEWKTDGPHAWRATHATIFAGRSAIDSYSGTVSADTDFNLDGQSVFGALQKDCRKP